MPVIVEIGIILVNITLPDGVAMNQALLCFLTFSVSYADLPTSMPIVRFKKIILR